MLIYFIQVFVQGRGAHAHRSRGGRGEGHMHRLREGVRHSVRGANTRRDMSREVAHDHHHESREEFIFFLQSIYQMVDI